jgi:hypothetical protein
LGYSNRDSKNIFNTAFIGETEFCLADIHKWENITKIILTNKVKTYPLVFPN